MGTTAMEITPGIDRRGYRERQYIFREGETGDHAFVVERGTVEIVKTVGFGEVVLGRVTKGGMFGEMALIDDSPRMASARAADEEVQVLAIKRAAFDQRLSGVDAFTKALIDILASHVRSIAKQLDTTDTALS